MCLVLHAIVGTDHGPPQSELASVRRHSYLQVAAWFGLHNGPRAAAGIEFQVRETQLMLGQ